MGATASLLAGKSISGNAVIISQVIINVVNYIVIPCLVVAVVSPNCFYYALVAAPPVLSTAVSAQCAVFSSTLQCLQYSYTFVPTSYHPPFTYNYQCSASIITYYAPTFVNMCIVSTFVTPLLQYGCAWLYVKSTGSPNWHRWVGYMLPRILKPNASTIGISDRGYLNSNGLVTSLWSTLTLIMTFGIMFPPLCVALVINIVAAVYLFRVNVCRLVNSTAEIEKQHVVEILLKEGNRDGLMQLFKFSVWVLVTVSCWFYTLFLFDTLGDAVGFERAYWVLIVLPAMPILFYFVYVLVCKYVHINTCQDHHIGPSKSEEGVELHSISVVHNALLISSENDTDGVC